MYYTSQNYYIYNNSHLNPDGWLQGCLKCGIITGDYYFQELLIRNNKKYHIYIYMCSKCKKLCKENEKENEKIYNYYDNIIYKTFYHKK